MTDPEKPEVRIRSIAGYLAELEDQPEYVERADDFEKFKKRLQLHGFQMSRLAVVVRHDYSPDDLSEPTLHTCSENPTDFSSFLLSVINF